MIGNNPVQDLHMTTRTPSAEALTAPLYVYSSATPMQEVRRVLNASNKPSETNASNMSPFLIYLRYHSPGMTPPRLDKLISNNAQIPKS